MSRIDNSESDLKNRLPALFSKQVISARRFHLRTDRIAHLPVAVLGGGLELCRPDYVIDRSGFPYPIIEFVSSGAGRLVMNGKKYEIIPGTIFCYAKGIKHRITTDPEHHPLVKYFVVFMGRNVRAWLRSRNLQLGTVVQVAEPERIRQILDDLIDLGLGDRTDREACCAQTAHYLMLKIADSIIPEARLEARAFHTYQRCRHYIETNALSLSSLSDVAKACHVDAAYLCRLFQRFGREPPMHFVQHVRMNHAMTLLQTTNRLIKEIAAELQFHDAANFTRAFRRWFGVPPQSIRTESH